MEQQEEGFLNHILHEFNNKNSSDVKIEIYPKEELIRKEEEKKIPIICFSCHLLVLIRCKYWKKMMIENELIENKERIVKWFILDGETVTLKIIELFIRCFYMDRNAFDSTTEINENFLSLHYLSNYIGFEDLKNYIEEKLIHSLDLNNVIDILDYVLYLDPRKLNQKENKHIGNSTSILYKVLFQWIFAFYPLEPEFRQRVKDCILKNNIFLFEKLLKSKDIMIENLDDRLKLLRFYKKKLNEQKLYDENHYKDLKIYILNQFSERENVIKKYVFFKYPNHLQPKKQSKTNLSETLTLFRFDENIFELNIVKELNFYQFSWSLKLLYDSKTQKQWFSLFAIPLTPRTNKKILQSSISKHKSSISKIEISLVLKLLTPLATLTILMDGIIESEICRLDITDAKLNELDPFELNQLDPITLQDQTRSIVPIIFQLTIKKQKQKY